ncbi:hypothetical protein [Wukongibacter sp. M2B1]|uniref:hypothetical protein n=1 Tax=Wukongibacter sp. M2B1 TaxID=3088895 RepID=UPI003D7C04EC
MKIIKSGVLIAFCALFAFIGLSFNKTKQDDNNVHTNYVGIKNSIEEVYNQSDLVVTGNVKESYSYKIGNMIFTNYKIAIDETIKTKYDGFKDEIEVVQSGGRYEGQERVFKEIKPLEIGNTYLFLLNKTWPEKTNNNFFTPYGAFQGVIDFKIDKTAKMTKDEKKIVKGFNKANKIEEKLINKDLNKMLKELK